jgi:hypothetical protein
MEVGGEPSNLLAHDLIHVEEDIIINIATMQSHGRPKTLQPKDESEKPIDTFPAVYLTYGNDSSDASPPHTIPLSSLWRRRRGAVSHASAVQPGLHATFSPSRKTLPPKHCRPPSQFTVLALQTKPSLSYPIRLSRPSQRPA